MAGEVPVSLLPSFDTNFNYTECTFQNEKMTLRIKGTVEGMHPSCHSRTSSRCMKNMYADKGVHTIAGANTASHIDFDAREDPGYALARTQMLRNLRLPTKIKTMTNITIPRSGGYICSTTILEYSGTQPGPRGS